MSMISWTWRPRSSMRRRTATACLRCCIFLGFLGLLVLRSAYEKVRLNSVSQICHITIRNSHYLHIIATRESVSFGRIPVDCKQSSLVIVAGNPLYAEVLLWNIDVGVGAHCRRLKWSSVTSFVLCVDVGGKGGRTDGRGISERNEGMVYHVIYLAMDVNTTKDEALQLPHSWICAVYLEGGSTLKPECPSSQITYLSSRRM